MGWSGPGLGGFGRDGLDVRGVLVEDVFGVVDVFGDELLVGVVGGADQLEQAVDVVDDRCPARER